MGSTEQSMGYVHDEIGRAVGLPSVLGGIPLDEFGATGFGVAVCADVLSGAVPGFPGGRAVPRDDILGMDCEILIPAAQPDVVTADNAGRSPRG